MFMSHEDQPNTLTSCNPPDEDAPDPDQLFLALMTSNPVVIEETVEVVATTTTASNTTPAAIPIAATPENGRD